ncbi:MAG: hypothetical protein WA220_08685 [Candidatus Nitrosopolaris sp.]
MLGPITYAVPPGLNLTKCAAAEVDAAAPAKHPIPCVTSTFLSNVAAKVESHGPAMKLIVPGELLITTVRIWKRLPT